MFKKVTRQKQHYQVRMLILHERDKYENDKKVSSVNHNRKKTTVLILAAMTAKAWYK